MSSLQSVGRSIVWTVSELPGMRSFLLRLCRIGLIPEAIWKRIPVSGTFDVALPDGTMFRYHAVRNDQIGRRLFWGGIDAFEPETVNEYFARARQASLVLDIGANTGLYAVLACRANPESTVFAVEPVPRINALLRGNIALNQLEERCHSFAAAVTDYVGAAQFHVPFGDVPTSASLEPTGFRGNDGKLVSVDAITVDSLVSGLGRVDLVKIDVEGFEDRVLKGMTHTLAEYCPTIIVECNPDGPIQEIESILTTFDYRFFHIRGDGSAPISHITPDSTERFRNILCIHSSRSVE